MTPESRFALTDKIMVVTLGACTALSVLAVGYGAKKEFEAALNKLDKKLQHKQR